MHIGDTGGNWVLANTLNQFLEWPICRCYFIQIDVVELGYVMELTNTTKAPRLMERVKSYNYLGPDHHASAANVLSGC